jgi:hypothetical protein
MAQKTIQGRLEYLLEKLDSRCQGTPFIPNLPEEEENDEQDEEEEEALKNQMELLEAKCRMYFGDLF